MYAFANYDKCTKENEEDAHILAQNLNMFRGTLIVNTNKWHIKLPSLLLQITFFLGCIPHTWKKWIDFQSALCFSDANLIISEALWPPQDLICFLKPMSWLWVTVVWCIASLQCWLELWMVECITVFLYWFGIKKNMLQTLSNSSFSPYSP